MATKILVIDDDINICELLRLNLTQEGYEVKTANDGVEGINYVKGEDGIIVPHTVGDGVYNMNMLYTGSAFLLEYSADWTESMKKLAENQNDESVVLLTPPVTPAPTPDAQN